MSTYASRVLYRQGCDNTVLRQQKSEQELLRTQNISKAKFRASIRSFDTESRQRDSMKRHWDFHRQNLVTQQNKFAQFNMMWAARDDMYRKRRDDAYRRRITRYNDENEEKAARTDDFITKKHHVLTEWPEQQREMLSRKMLMTGHSQRNEVELFRYHDENPTMFVRPMTVPI
jgi:hypothetical protein